MEAVEGGSKCNKCRSCLCSLHKYLGGFFGIAFFGAIKSHGIARNSSRKELVTAGTTNFETLDFFRSLFPLFPPNAEKFQGGPNLNLMVCLCVFFYG
jgi:hypothetical protein